MKSPEFLAELQDLLQTDASLFPETRLEELPEWDSLAVMILVTWLDRQFARLCNYDDIMACATCADLMKLVEIE